MKRVIKVLVLLAILPFVLVWTGFVLTGFSYNPIQIFQSGAFWGTSILYWLLYVCLIGVISELVEETNS